MRVRFSDDAGEPITEASAQALMAEVDRFFRGSSHGTVTLTTTVTGLLTLPGPRALHLTENGCLGGVSAPRLLEQAREAAAAAGYVPGRFDLDCVYVDAPFVGAGAFGNIGRKGVWLRVPDVGLACHEFGHNFGLWHANAWETLDDNRVGPGFNVERGNRFDTMGSGTSQLWDFNAYSKYQLGWLPTASIRTLATNGIYRAHPSDSPSLADGRAYALRLPGKDLAREYWIETRRQSDGHSQCRQSLLLYWTPWGASYYGTHLLGAHPSHPAIDDAHLRPGEAFEDTEMGIKILPLPTAAEDPDAVDVLVQTLESVLLEAEEAEHTGDLAVSSDAGTSRGACITASGPGRLQFAVNLPVAGHYAIWGRVRGASPPPAGLRVTVDFGRGGTGRLPAASLSDRWDWQCVTRGTARPVGQGPEIPDLLSEGRHILGVEFDSPGLALDCLLVTTDLTKNLAPFISPIPPRQTLTDHALGPVPFSVLDVETPASDLRILAESSNPRLVPSANLVLGGTTMDRSVTATPAPGQFGRSTIVLAVLDADGNRRATSFEIRVVGPLQARVESTAPGDTLVVESGTHFDALILTREISLLADPRQPVVLDGGGVGIPLTVGSNATARLRGFVIRNGWGGAVRNDGVLTLQDCVVADCRRTLEGTVVNHGSLRLERCVIRGNSACNGGGLGNHGSALVEDCTIGDNVASQQGGAVRNGRVGRLVIQRSTLSGNRTAGGSGGAIDNAGELRLANSTISGNTAGRDDPETPGGAGGALANFGHVTIEACTIVSNRAEVAAAGIENQGTLVLRDTILAGNRLADDTPDDGRGSLDSRGYNLIQSPAGFMVGGDPTGNQWGLDPRLAPLADSGGPTPTHTPRKGSPAIDRGFLLGPALDQRGLNRPYDEVTVPNLADGSDIGACEFIPAIDEPQGPATGGPRLQFGPGVGGSGVVLMLVGVQPGSVHVLLASTNLVEWWGVATNTASDGVLEFGPVATLGVSRRFYRTRGLP